jgi:hypothetical protein
MPMWRLILAIVLALSVLTVPPTSVSAQSQAYNVDGWVQTKTGQPISALTVYLYHPSLGRSYPRFTDVNGYFIFERVSYSPTDYYLEVYWGNTLMYREAITVDRYVRRSSIVLG